MIEGVYGANVMAGIVRKMTRKSCEPDGRKTDAVLDKMPTQGMSEDSVTIKRQEPGPSTYAKPLKTGQRQDCAFLMLRKLVAKILQDQHTANQIDDGDIETIVMDKITPEKAKALVANDGHWKPDQTAARIFSFSLTISGYNPKKLDKIKDSITEGFQLAKESFGGELPEISGKTFTAVMSQLHEWAENCDNSESI